jgi:hypothetical protein
MAKKWIIVLGSQNDPNATNPDFTRYIPISLVLTKTGEARTNQGLINDESEGKSDDENVNYVFFVRSNACHRVYSAIGMRSKF